MQSPELVREAQEEDLVGPGLYIGYIYIHIDMDYIEVSRGYRGDI